jgi:pimeloyl-ACP methyl ester carboxylesterase
MANQTHETAPTQFVEADGLRFAYRRFGKAGGAPLVFMQYFDANMDGWDPAMVNGFAADYDVVLFDNAGVASSSGETPSTVSAMTLHCVLFCRALGFAKIIVVGFSLGGMIAQQLACDYPEFVEQLILLGTGPRGGEGMTFTELSAEEQADPISFLMAAFFTSSEQSRAAGRAFVERMSGRQTGRDLPVSTKTAEAQLKAIREWGAIPPSDRYSSLKGITHPVLIVHGSKDIVVMPINAFILAEHLPNAQLIIYPDSSHGAHYQHGHLFLRHAKLFLSGTKIVEA